MKISHALSITLMFMCAPLNAQVSLDGTLGRSGALPGPNYQIGAHDGQQQGGNLFHSFQDFNLQSHESATFSGPNNVNNVISRVTGGNPSNIDGLLRSTIPNADMYFLNPYGIMFGPNAKLDVQGSFHVSTADTLRLQDGGQFNAREPGNSLLTVAPVEAFGFLTNTPAAITTEDSDLSVPAGQTFSLIGGDLHLNGQSPIQFDGRGFAALFARSKLSAASGRINLASVASIGEIIPREFKLDLTGDGGTITANNTLIDVSGRGGGEVFIRGGQFVMEDATIQANTLADLNGKNIDMRLTESIDIRGDLLSVLNQTFGSGNGGDIVTKAPRLEVTGSWIAAATTSTGNSGDIDIEAEQVSLKDGGTIQGATFGSGQGGSLHIKAKETLSFKGRRNGNITRGEMTSEDTREEITWEDFPSNVYSITTSTGHAGAVTIETGHLTMADLGFIDANSFGEGNANDVTLHASRAELTGGAEIASYVIASGRGGNVNITVADTLSIEGKSSEPVTYPFFGTFEEYTSNIYTGTSTTGQAGHISVKANTLLLTDEGGIGSYTIGEGQGGHISINANTLLLADHGYIDASIWGKGDANGITIHADTIEVKDGAVIASTVFSSGQGGNLNITADTLSIEGRLETPLSGVVDGIDFKYDQSEVSSGTWGTGSSGDLSIEVNTLLLDDGAIYASTWRDGAAGKVVIKTKDLQMKKDAIITSFSGQRFVPGAVVGSGDGGHIVAGSGEGGHIFIQADHLLLTDNSILTTESLGTGNAGDILVSANTINLTDQSAITTEAKNATGGNITITMPNLLYLRGGQITTSVGSGEGSGGDITISQPVFVVLDKGQIKAQADEGRGGDIHITTNQFIASNDSLVSASSRLGLDGDIKIDAPEVNMADFMVVLPGGFVDVSLKRCDIQEIDNPSRFTITHPHRVPPFVIIK